jgi:hypothetical protein
VVEQALLIYRLFRLGIPPNGAFADYQDQLAQYSRGKEPVHGLATPGSTA